MTNNKRIGHKPWDNSMWGHRVENLTWEEAITVNCNEEMTVPYTDSPVTYNYIIAFKICLRLSEYCTAKMLPQHCIIYGIRSIWLHMLSLLPYSNNLDSAHQ